MPIEMHPLQDKSIDAVILANGHRILIRPMMRQDIDLQVQFFNSLSKEARYNRFLNPMPTLSADLIDLLQRVDHHSHVALMAEITSEGRAISIADARFVAEPDRASAEIAIAVTDRFQRLGLGSFLMSRLISAAYRAGIDRLFGHSFASNGKMLGLARRSGFTVGRDPQFPYLARLEKNLDAIERPGSRMLDDGEMTKRVA